MSLFTYTSSHVRLKYLDSLRGLAAFYVLLHHEFLQVWPIGDPGPGLFQKCLGIFRFGHYSVDLFIVLSGFSLMLPLVSASKELKVEILKFVLRRARRILPPYYFALGLSLFLIGIGLHKQTGTHWDRSLPVTLKSVWTHLLLLHDAFGEDMTINHALWSIAVEWRVYFFFPVLIFLWRSLGAYKTTAIAVGLSFILYNGFDYFLGVNLTFHYLGLFAMGMLAAWISYGPVKVSGRWKQYDWGRITVLLLLVVALALGGGLRAEPLPLYLKDYVFGILCFSFLLFLSGSDNSFVLSILNWGPLVSLGGFSYSLYLIHSPLVQVLWQYLFVPFQRQPLLMFGCLLVLGTPLIVGSAFLFHVFCERPFFSKK